MVFSDGEDQGSHVTVAEVEQWLQSSDLILYMIGQGQGVVREPLKKLMDRLSRPTGGRAISTNSIDELHDSFTELLEEISNQYVLGYQPTNTRPRRHMARHQGERRRPSARPRAAGIPRDRQEVKPVSGRAPASIQSRSSVASGSDVS